MNKDLPLSGLKLIQLKIFPDNRGYFTEWYQEDRFHQYGITSKFIQDNCSRSKPGVIRGLHYQSNPDIGKLVGVIRGAIWDVVVDIRSGSPTYGRWHAEELSDVNGKLLWIPPGFAHGFAVLGNEDASVVYKTDAAWSPTGEGGICYNDPTLQIQWPLQKEPIVSSKDLVLPTFAEYQKKPVY